MTSEQRESPFPLQMVDLTASRPRHTRQDAGCIKLTLPNVPSSLAHLRNGIALAVCRTTNTLEREEIKNAWVSTQPTLASDPPTLPPSLPSFTSAAALRLKTPLRGSFAAGTA